MDRRHFLMGSAVAAGAARASSLASANDTIRVACVGLKGRGRDHIMAFGKMKNIQIAALCDVDDSITAERMKDVEKLDAGTAGHVPRHPQGCSTTSPSTRFPSPRPTTGTRCRPSGPARPARTSTCEKPVLAQRVRVQADRRGGRASTTASCRRAARAAPRPPCRRPCKKMRDGELGEIYMARGLCFKARNTIGRRRSSRSRRRRLRHVDRPRADAPVHQEPLPLQLALVLGHRQRRPRQPGNPRSGYLPLGPGRDPPDQGQRHRRQVHVRRRPGDAQHADASTTSSTSTARRR